ncbi:MAG: LCP family protein [Lachnospiraceae bacterium]|nr:LCP family protein [Lachnospiraceae bacterium]
MEDNNRTDVNGESTGTELVTTGSSELAKKTGTELAKQGSSEIAEINEKGSKEVVKHEKKTSDVIDEDDAEFIKKEDEEARRKQAARDEAANTDPSEEFADELSEIEHEAEDNEIVKSVSASIKDQVDQEIEAAAENAENPEPTDEEKEEKKGIAGFLSRIPKWIYILAGIALFIIILVWILDASGLGEKLLIKLGAKVAAVTVDYQPLDPENTEIMPGNVESIEEFMDQLTPIPTTEPTPTPPDPTPTQPVYEKKIINILLLGEENIGSYTSRGRTDMIVLATIDTISKTVKLTSLMRDSFVQIPGYDDNRINAAYALGGVPLLYATIEKNFGITPDSYCLVRFDDFEKIVDSVGGVDITLSAKEAKYLNKTNYISKPEYRTVKEGVNHMNGNQVLGYCRVRYVAKDGEKNDFGRTTRHRVAISALIDKVKDLGYADLVRVGLECLPMVTTDVTEVEIERYTQMILDIGGKDITIKEMRIPMDGTYKFVTIRKMSVTQLDIAKNREALHDFIYGDYVENADAPTPTPTLMPSPTPSPIPTPTPVGKAS